MIAVKFMLSHATVTNFRKSFFLPLHPCNNMAISNINIWLKSLSLIFFKLTPKTMLILWILLSALTTSSRNLHWHMSRFKVLPQKMKLNPQLYQRNLINWMITTMQKNVITGAPIYDEDRTWTLEDVDEVYTKLGYDCDDKKQTTNLQYVCYSSSLLSN